MKKLLFILLMSLSCVCFAQNTYNAKLTTDFFGESYQEDIRARIVVKDSSIVVYEKKDTATTILIFYTPLEPTLYGNSTDCIELTPGVYGYDKTYTGYNLVNREYYILNFRVITTKHSYYLRDIFVIGKLSNGNIQETTTYYHKGQY